MDFKQKFDNWIQLPIEVAIKRLPRPDSEEARYFNAKIIVQVLEEKLQSSQESTYEFETPEEIQKRITMWNQLIGQMDSKQNLATS